MTILQAKLLKFKYQGLFNTNRGKISKTGIGIRTWISNDTHIKLGDAIIRPRPNFSGDFN